MELCDVKIYEDSKEKETIRGLTNAQAIPLKDVLMRHGIRHTVKRIEQSEQADGNKVVLDGTFRCPECNFLEKHLASCSRR